MFLEGTPVTVDRRGTEVAVERIVTGQRLWNPLTGADVEVVRVLIRQLPARLATLPQALRPHLLPAHAVHPNQPTQPLSVLPALRCLCPVLSPSGIAAFDAFSLQNRNLPLAPLDGSAPSLVVLILTKAPSLVAVSGLLVCLDCPEGFLGRLPPNEGSWSGKFHGLH